MEGCSVASGGWVKEVDGRENGVGINAGAATTSIGGKRAGGGVFVGLSRWSARKSAGGEDNAHLLETQEVGRLFVVPWNDVCLAELLS